MRHIIFAMLVSVLGAATQLSAAPLTVFEDGFESAINNPGDAAGSPVVGDSWTVVEDDAGDVSISAGSYTGSKGALFQRLAADPDPSEAHANLTASATSAVSTAGSARIEFAFQKSSQSDSSAIGIFNLDNGATSGIISVRLDDNGNVVYYDGSTTVDTTLNYTLGTYQEIALDLDFVSHEFTISVGGATTAGSTGIAFNINENTFTSFNIIAGKDAVFRIDDVLITTTVADIPEPATLVMSLLGVAPVILGRRRRG